ncbi:coatomer subunit alpha-3 [Artemisia annua]|uniref:Coatomer subunit alpha-3 n=1 Tax=Artemisia annua TaxID=35608 RepID=A0A2U1NG98_ARTAN|nr:coatomer subunit alpha-3 [Artemisia annua]
MAEESAAGNCCRSLFKKMKNVDGGSYELYIIPKDGLGRGDTVQEAKRGVGASAVFVAWNRFAVLEKSTNQVLVKNLKNEIVKKSDLPVATDAIFYAGNGNLLCSTEDRVFIFDLQQRLVLGDLQTSFVRYVVWSNDMESVALLSKHSIIIADKKLVHRCTLHERIRVKSGSWDDNGVFIYTTVTHIKYWLPNGDSGIIRTLDVPVYITKIFGNTLFCLDRDGKNLPIVIDSTEYILKLSLLKKRYDHVMSMVRDSELCGQAMIVYLQQKGFPEVALHFVKDERTRFNLALESGNIQIAVASAKEIDENDHWYRLGVEALRQGNAGIVEYAYQRTKNFERLSFLYLITGNLDKLSKMMKIAEVRNDVMGQFHNALYLGDVQERIKILVNAGHLPLAYATAKTHGLNDIRLVLGDLQTSFVRYVVWSNDMESVALLSKHSIIIADKKLVHRCTLHERIRVKSGSWDDNGVFIYTTVTHIKYWLPNGDSGIIRTLDVPVYITKIFGNTLFCLDRDGKNLPIVIDSTEYILKLSLLKKRYDHVMSMVRDSELCGQAMIVYLQQKGFPEVALHFVKDERTRFNLALESGNIQIAVASAKEIDENDHWYRLGVEALRQGNAGIVEYAYQRTKNFERLSFLYLITGNLDKLSKMMKIAEVRNDVMGQFHNALYLGDVRERIKILVNAGHLPLAYATAKTHGLNDIVEDLAEKLEGNVPSLPNGRYASLLMPPTPVLCGGDWPLLRVMKGIFAGGLDNVEKGANEDYHDADWGEDLDIVDVENIQNGEIDDEENEEGAAGNFDTAMRLLSRQLGIKNFTPLKSLFIDLHMGSHTYLRAFSSTPLITLGIERGWSESASPNVRAPPALVFNFSQLKEKLEAGKKATTTGKFTEALRLFLSILHTIPLIVVESRSEVDKVKELIFIVKEYVLGLQMELKRRELKDEPVRQQELAAYFTHCNLELKHLRLALSNAMTVCYKAGNLITASNFARRLLETNPTAENQMKTARSVMQAAEKNMQDKMQLNYDFRNPFVVCGATYVPIYRGQKDVLCPYCTSHFVISQEGQLCTVCDLAVVGSDASGLVCSPAQIR